MSRVHKPRYLPPQRPFESVHSAATDEVAVSAAMPALAALLLKGMAGRVASAFRGPLLLFRTSLTKSEADAEAAFKQGRFAEAAKGFIAAARAASSAEPSDTESAKRLYTRAGDAFIADGRAMYEKITHQTAIVYCLPGQLKEAVAAYAQGADPKKYVEALMELSVFYDQDTHGEKPAMALELVERAITAGIEGRVLSLEQLHTMYQEAAELHAKVADAQTSSTEEGAAASAEDHQVRAAAYWRTLGNVEKAHAILRGVAESLSDHFSDGSPFAVRREAAALLLEIGELGTMPAEWTGRLVEEAFSRRIITMSESVAPDALGQLLSTAEDGSPLAVYRAEVHRFGEQVGQVVSGDAADVSVIQDAKAVVMHELDAVLTELLHRSDQLLEHPDLHPLLVAVRDGLADAYRLYSQTETVLREEVGRLDLPPPLDHSPILPADLLRAKSPAVVLELSFILSQRLDIPYLTVDLVMQGVTEVDPQIRGRIVEAVGGEDMLKGLQEHQPMSVIERIESRHDRKETEREASDRSPK